MIDSFRGYDSSTNARTQSSDWAVHNGTSSGEQGSGHLVGGHEVAGHEGGAANALHWRARPPHGWRRALPGFKMQAVVTKPGNLRLIKKAAVGVAIAWGLL
jgi:hypothetical protein